MQKERQIVRTAVTPTRRAVLQSLSVAALGAGPPTGPLSAQPAPRSLGELAASRGLLFGASFATHELDKPTGANYAALYLGDAKIITSELEFKMSTLRPSPGSIQFDPPDRFMAFARAADMKTRGHTLIWNDDLPAWIKALSNTEATALLDSHLTAVMTRYKGRVHSWDVVNEPIAPWENTPGKMRTGPFYAALGRGYIDRSFRLARQLDPTAKLVLNEQSTDRFDDYGKSFRDNFGQLVDDLLSAGVPIDAIGLQCHLMPSKPFDFDGYARYIERFTKAGLEVHITELDVEDVALSSDPLERDGAIAKVYADFLSVVLQNKRITQLILWQLGDGHSWYTYQSIEKGVMDPNRRPRPLLYDANYKVKPAWSAVANALAKMPKR
jgi:endo-1,4-beta-xylanase